MGLFTKLSTLSDKKWALGCGALALLLGVAIMAAGLQVIDYPIVAMRSEQVEKEYRAAGLPWVASDVDRHIPAADNASAEFLEEMESQGRSLPRSTSTLEAAMSDYDYAAARKEIDFFKDYIAKFELASRAKAIAFSKDWDQGGDVLFPEFVKFKDSVKLLSWRAEIRASEGDLEGAMTDLRTAFRLGDQIGQEPILIALLVGIGCQKTALKGVEYVGALRPNDAVWIGRIRKEIGGWQTTLNFESALQGEAYWWISIPRNLRDKEVYLDLKSFDSEETYIPRAASKLVRDGFGKGAVRRAYQTRSMEISIGIKKIRDRHKNDPTFSSREIEKYFERELTGSKKMSNSLMELLYPVIADAGYSVAKNQLGVGMTDAVLRAGEIKARTGKFPEDWKGLGLAPLIDPVTKESVKVRVKNGVFFVYLVGFNGKEEENFEQKIRLGDDVYFQFPVKRRLPLHWVGTPGNPGVPGGNLIR